MKVELAALLAGSSMLAMASPAIAQSAGAPASAESDQSASDIVVNARRRDELLQDVPASISVVGGDQLQDLAILRMEDIEQIVPGMDLNSSSQGTLAGTTFRGASYDASTSSSNIVAFYVNDAPAGANDVLQGAFDVGQIEVLRGTQGTLRGQSAPSGAITITTRRPDLQEFGGYASSTFTDADGINVQGALNIPLVEDMLAFRIAGLVDENEMDGVRSVNHPANPEGHTEAVRGTLRFEPTSTLAFNLTYDDLRTTNTTLGGAHVGGPALGYPALSPSDRLGISWSPSTGDTGYQRYILNADWDIGWATLSYVGSDIDGETNSANPNDTTDSSEGIRVINVLSGTTTDEVRIASNEPVAGLFDYVFGAFESRQQASVEIPSVFTSNSGSKEDSIFGNLNFHFGERTELSVGARYVEQESSGTFGGSEETATLWSASLSHDVTDNFMVYGSAGTAMRFTNPGVLILSFGISGFIQPDLQAALTQPPEESENYEIGFKADFLDGRLLLNAAVFQQQYENFVFLTPPVAYDANLTPEGTDDSAARFTWATDTVIQGVDLDATFQVTPNWNLGAAVSYAKSEADGDVPCNDANGDGVPDGGRPTGFDDGGPFPTFVTCPYTGSISANPEWNASLQTEVLFPFSNDMEGFVRGFYTYYPENENDSNPTFTADAYGLLNLFVGLRAPQGGWEVMAFARNALDEETELSRGSLLVAPTYVSTVVTQPQVFGVSLRTAFGSR